MHYFATFFQLIYFQYKATPRKHKPESLSLDLTKPVRVLSSPQSQSSSSNIGGGNNSSLEVLEMEEEEMMTTTVVESGIKSQA
jgi:hypothetical protein